jgi:PIN domain nuclease of toxin-antitoxin system
MKPSLLLDTCVLLWILDDDPRITGNKEIVNLLNLNQRYFSPISVAEIEIKVSLGKLAVPDNYLDQIIESGISEWPFRSSDARGLSSLPYHHKDPFDRMLIASALIHNLIIVTSDAVFRQYPVTVYSVD